MPNLYIIAGCNGAGKTTASYTILPEMLKCKEFVNADEGGVGIEFFESAVDHILDEVAHLVLIEITDVAFLDFIKDITEGISTTGVRANNLSNFGRTWLASNTRCPMFKRQSVAPSLKESKNLLQGSDKFWPITAINLLAFKA